MTEPLLARWADDIEAEPDARANLVDLERVLSAWHPDAQRAFLKSYSPFGLRLRSSLGATAGPGQKHVNGFVLELEAFANEGPAELALSKAREVAKNFPDFVRTGLPGVK